MSKYDISMKSTARIGICKSDLTGNLGYYGVGGKSVDKELTCYDFSASNSENAGSWKASETILMLAQICRSEDMRKQRENKRRFFHHIQDDVTTLSVKDLADLAEIFKPSS